MAGGFFVSAMNRLSKLMRYVGELEPPTLWSKIQEAIAEMARGQSGPPEETEQLFFQLLKRKPATIKAMCFHERDMPLLDMLRIKTLCELEADEFAALYMATAPATLIGDIVRISHLGGPLREVAPCQSCTIAFVRPRYWKGVRKV